MCQGPHFFTWGIKSEGTERVLPTVFPSHVSGLHLIVPEPLLTRLNWRSQPDKSNRTATLTTCNIKIFILDVDMMIRSSFKTHGDWMDKLPLLSFFWHLCVYGSVCVLLLAYCWKGLLMAANIFSSRSLCDHWLQKDDVICTLWSLAHWSLLTFMPFTRFEEFDYVWVHPHNT